MQKPRSTRFRAFLLVRRLHLVCPIFKEATMATDPIFWLTLSGIPGLGPVGIANLLHHFQTPDRILQAPVNELQRTDGIGPQLARQIAYNQPQTWAKEQMKRALMWNIGVIGLDDPNYPRHLKEIFAPPPFLFFRGNLQLAQAPTIAIVGSRAFTPYGKNIAYQLSSDLVRIGVTIVSGLALGIDTHAHRGALEQNGATIAVLGSSIDHPYPPQNRDLFNAISQSGLVLSEFPLGTKPEAHNFPRRNRIISGLSLGTVVVEAGERSGALITAQFALEQNRDVFAVPGPIHSGRSIGTHKLIQQGAQLVLSTQDILSEIRQNLPPSAVSHQQQQSPPLDSEEKEIWDHLTTTPQNVNTIARLINRSSQDTLQYLLGLTLKDLVTQSPGLNFCKKQ